MYRIILHDCSWPIHKQHVMYSDGTYIIIIYTYNTVLGSCWLHDMFQCYVFKVYSAETDTHSFIVKESAGFSYQSFFKMYSLHTSKSFRVWQNAISPCYTDMHF